MRSSSRPRSDCRWGRGRTAPACRASASSRASTLRCGGSAWTTSICSTSTASTTRLSRRSSPPSMTSCGPARRSTRRPRPCRSGSSCGCARCSARPGHGLSWRCRTCSTSSTARRSARCCPIAPPRALRWCRGRRSRAAFLPATSRARAASLSARGRTSPAGCSVPTWTTRSSTPCARSRSGWTVAPRRSPTPGCCSTRR